MVEHQVRFDACLDTLQLPSIAGANALHLHALQRYVTPIIQAELESVFRDSENSPHSDSANASKSERSQRSTKLIRFQEALRDDKRRSAARSNLLARVISQTPEPSASQCVALVENALFSCAHTLLASQPHTAALFAAHKNRLLRINTKTTPLKLLQAIFLAASDAAYEQPFLFLRDVSAREYIAKRQRVVALIDDLVEAKLYDACSKSIAALRTHVRHNGAPASVTSRATTSLATSQSLPLENNDAKSEKSSIVSKSDNQTTALESADTKSISKHVPLKRSCLEESLAAKESSKSLDKSKSAICSEKVNKSAQNVESKEQSEFAQVLQISLPTDCESNVLRSLGAASVTSDSHRNQSPDSNRPIVQLIE